jgi:hypothetical protein
VLHSKACGLMWVEGYIAQASEWAKLVIEANLRSRFSHGFLCLAPKEVGQSHQCCEQPSCCCTALQGTFSVELHQNEPQQLRFMMR